MFRISPPLRMHFLGLDISSRVTGYTVLNSNGIPVECGYIDTRKQDNIYACGQQFSQFVSNLTQKYSGPWIVGVENYMQKFSKSSSTVLFKLASVNAIYCYELFNHLSAPNMIHVIQARSFFHLNLHHNKQLQTTLSAEVNKISAAQKKKTQKRIVFEKVRHLMEQTGYKIETGKRNSISDVNFDVSDSMLIAIYLYVSHRIQSEHGDQKKLFEYIKTIEKVYPQMYEKVAKKYKVHTWEELIDNPNVIQFYSKWYLNSLKTKYLTWAQQHLQL